MGFSRKWINSATLCITEKAIRIISKSHYLDHTSPIFKSLETLNIFQIYESICLGLAFKCINFHAFPYYRRKISQNFNVHTHNTRCSDNYRINERARMRIVQRSYMHKGILLWNALDSFVKDYYSISTFKKKIKSYLLDNS